MTVQDCPSAMVGTNKNEYVCRRQGASACLWIGQQIIDPFDPHDRHDHAKSLLVM